MKSSKQNKRVGKKTVKGFALLRNGEIIQVRKVRTAHCQFYADCFTDTNGAYPVEEITFVPVTITYSLPSYKK